MKKFSVGFLMILWVLAASLAFGADYKFVTIGGQATKEGVTGDVVGSSDVQSLTNKFYNIDLVTLGALKNGTTNGVLLTDDTPDGEWAAIDAATVVTADATIFKVGTKSLKVHVTKGAAANKGIINTLGGGDQDWSADESVGVWIYTTTALAAGDLQLNIVDNATDHKVNIPAVATTGTWTWVKIDVSGVADADKNVITDLKIQLSAAGAAKAAIAAFDVYFDFMFKWDVGDEVALNRDVPYGGVQTVLAALSAAAGANTFGKLVEYTDYFIDYRTGDDKLICITDQSTFSGLALVFYQ